MGSSVQHQTGVFLFGLQPQSSEELGKSQPTDRKELSTSSAFCCSVLFRVALNHRWHVLKGPPPLENLSASQFMGITWLEKLDSKRATVVLAPSRSSEHLCLGTSLVGTGLPEQISSAFGADAEFDGFGEF